MIEELYSKHYKELLGWCTSMTQNLQQAEDLVQEAFLRAMNHVALLENLKETQRVAWMYRTMKNLYIDKIRHASFETVTENLPEAAETDSYNQIDYEQVLLQLLPKERELFVMQYQGYNSNEIGKILGISAGTVRSQLSSIRKKLRGFLRG